MNKKALLYIETVFTRGGISMSHLFHLIMDSEMINQLLQLDLLQKSGGFSDLIVEILQRLYPVIENNHFFGGELNSRYMPVNADRKLARSSIYVDLPERLYRRLKLIHHDLNVYSMAQLVRGVLRLYLNFVKWYGEKADQQIDMLCAKYQYRNQALPRGHEILKQLLRSSVLECIKMSFFTLYNDDFSPVMRLLC